MLRLLRPLLSQSGRLFHSSTTTRKSVLSKFPFPVAETPGKLPEVIFCHALGSSWTFPLPVGLESYVTEYHGHGFVRFQYRYFCDQTRVWHIDDWVEDIVSLLDRHEEKGKKQKSSVLVACCAAAQAAIRAAIKRPDKVHSILLLSPALGIELDYMDRVRPGSAMQLREGKSVLHPALPGAPEALFTLDCLLDYHKTDPVHNYEKIPLNCPVKIVHGMRDLLLPYENSLKFAAKLEREAEVVLLKNGGHLHLVHLNSEVLNLIDKILEGDSKKQLVQRLESDALRRMRKEMQESTKH